MGTPIEPGYRANFDTLLRAARDKRLALLDCQDGATGKPVRVIVALGDDPDTPDGFVFTPLAKLFDGDPYEEIRPPNPDGGYHPEEPRVRHTACKFCGQDIEGTAPFNRGEWRDRGNNTTCPNSVRGRKHAPVKET